MDKLVDLWKTPMKKGTKDVFLCKWKNKETWKKEINLARLNAAIITGSANDLIVLDVDIKKNSADVKAEGVQEFEKYTSEYGNIDTFIVKTPSGGYHYYFKYSNSSQQANYLIQNYLENSTGYRNAGLDVRTNGGVIIMPGSCNNLGTYEIFNDAPITEMPLTLLEWLLAVPRSHEKDIRKPKSIKSNRPRKDIQYIFYDLTEKKVEAILNMLPTKYLDNYSDWLKATTILKRHGFKDLWERWSKGSKLYNSRKNANFWERVIANLDINLLVAEMRDAGKNIKYFSRYKQYSPITRDISNITKFMMNNRYLYDHKKKASTFNYDLFDKYNTTIIQSCTGTGKTFAVAKHARKYLSKNKGTKVLSITSRTTLSDQHVISFNDIDMQHYKYFKGEFKNASNLTICINSLYRMGDLTNDQISDYVVYVDEIKPFLELTHNKTLDCRMREVMYILMRFIKHAKKVIVSDAMIDDNVFEFLKLRAVEETVFIENSFKKYKGIDAIRLRREHDFRDKLLNNCQSNRPFCFGCDSKTTVETLYHYCRNNTDPSLHHKFVLITDDYKKPLENITELFSGNFVFYSPKITFGIDHSIDEKTDVFIYIKGNSLQPHGMFQQATRCRNIEKLYYYGEVVEHDFCFTDLQEVKDDVKLGAYELSESLKECSSYTNEEEEHIFIENTFFNMFCYNEYVYDTYKTNKVKHFELILEENGFNMSVIGDAPVRIDGKTKGDMKSVVDDIKSMLFDEYLNETKEHRDQPKYYQINTNISYLCLQTESDETLKNYKDIIIDKYKIEEHENIIKLYKRDEYIEGKLLEMQHINFNVRVMNSVYNKIKIIRELETTYNIGFLNVAGKRNDPIEMKDGTYKLIKAVFKTSKKAPNNYKGLMKLYVGMLRNVSGSNLISSYQLNTKKDRKEVAYHLNETIRNFHLELNSYKNKRMKYFISDELVSEFIKRKPTDSDAFIDSDSEIGNCDSFSLDVGIDLGAPLDITI